ncbi:avidin/streptavidin family protein [Peteryoungia ipomoeae]|nr:avidin/streptavidin family protein [Peteryoungia ipomoeae]
MKFLAVLIALGLASPAVAMPANEQGRLHDRLIGSTTTWVNSYGSVMTLDVAANGAVRGYIVNNAPGTGCRGIPYDIRGRLKGEVLAFHVSWRNGVADCQSETEWRGVVRLTAAGKLEFVSHCHHRQGLLGDKVSIGVDRFIEQAPNRLQSFVDH